MQLMNKIHSQNGFDTDVEYRDHFECTSPCSFKALSRDTWNILVKKLIKKKVDVDTIRQAM